MPDATKPHPSRAALEAWLEKVNARHRWTESVAGFGEVRCYDVNGRVMLVQDMQATGRDFGWEIFVPASDSNTVRETLANAEAALGIAPHSVTLRTRESAYRDGQGKPGRPDFIYHGLRGGLHTGDVLLHDLVRDVTGSPVEVEDTVYLTILVEKADEE